MVKAIWFNLGIASGSGSSAGGRAFRPRLCVLWQSPGASVDALVCDPMCCSEYSKYTGWCCRGCSSCSFVCDAADSALIAADQAAELPDRSWLPPVNRAGTEAALLRAMTPPAYSNHITRNGTESKRPHGPVTGEYSYRSSEGGALGWRRDRNFTSCPRILDIEDETRTAQQEAGARYRRRLERTRRNPASPRSWP